MALLNQKRGGKLKMGPLWDFDLVFGGYPGTGETATWTNEPEGFVLREHGWYRRLFLNPVFVGKVKKRFSYYFSKREDIFNLIDSNASKLNDKVVEDNKPWGQVADSSSSSAEE